MKKLPIWISALLVAGTLLAFPPSYASYSSYTSYSSYASSLQEHIYILTSDSLSGRRVGSAGEKKAAAYISQCFESYGLDLGSDPILREEYIVIGAHYDHLGTQKITVDGKDSWVIYPGADDNASGVAILLEMSRMAAQQPYLFKRSLVFVAFGGEEMGMAGSWYFVHRAFSPIQKVTLMLNLDMLGRSGVRNPFSAYTIAPHVGLTAALHYAAELPAAAQPKVLGTDYFPSDHQNFYQNKIPVVLFTNGLHSEYHTFKDQPNLLDYTEMENRMNYIYSFLLQMANDEQWSPKEGVTIAPETVFQMSNVDKPPQFQRGDEVKFVKTWVNKYLKYPRSAIAQGIQGRVLVQFIIEANGSVTHVEVIESVDPLLDDEAVRVISASPKWSPGKKNGVNVRTRCTVPVYFILKRR